MNAQKREPVERNTTFQKNVSFSIPLAKLAAQHVSHYFMCEESLRVKKADISNVGLISVTM